MEASFWLERWIEGQIGFHQDRINSYLTQNWHKLGAPKGARLLVPLCGKSLDMLWLQEQGHSVLGVELSPLAVKAFFEENEIAPTVTKKNSFESWQGADVELLCGDFFQLQSSDIADIRYVYDRASLIALPPEMRERYAAHLAALLPTGGGVLLVTMEYPQEEMNGPPFSVHESEVHALYDAAFTVEKVEEQDILAANPRFKERGLSRLVEKTYLMRRQ